MSYIEELTKLIYHYREMMGKNPHTIVLGREAYDGLVKDIKDSVPLYEDEAYKDHKGFIFMGVNIEVCDDNGWDLYESETREEFEVYAMRKGYDIAGFTFFYKDSFTQALWEAYHKGHVSRRRWKE